MKLKLPSIKVKDEFQETVRICWTRFIGHNICDNMRLEIDSKEYQSFPKQYFDFEFQFNIPNEKKNQYKYLVGDIDFLTNWTDHLPSFPLIVPQPFYFSKDISQSINLSHFDVKEALFTYNVNRNIENLLRIQVKKNGEWIETENKTFEMLETVLEGGLHQYLPIPEIWARYGKQTKEEHDWRKNCTNNQSYFIENIIVCSPPNPVQLGLTSEIKINSTGPCKRIFWAAQNLNSLKKNLHSNYTTNDDDIEKGSNPCKKMILKYGQKIRSVAEEDDFSYFVPFKHCIGSPIHKGFCCYSYSNEPETLDADIAVPYKNDKILLITLGLNDNYKLNFKKINKKLEHTKEEIADLFIKEDRDELYKIESDNQFLLHVFLISYRKVEWKRNEQGKMILNITDDY
jgi:hypothetical protein